MYTHAIHNKNIVKNVRVEVVYENSPVFADEEVSAIIRFRHLGDKINEHADTATQNNGDIQGHNSEQNGENNGELNGEPSGDSATHEESGGWFGKRLSLQLTNTARSLFLDELEKKVEIPERNRPVELLSGYVQLSGTFTYDSESIDHEKIDGFREKTAISGKIGGLQGFEISKHRDHGYMSSITSGINGLFYSPLSEPSSGDQKPTNNDNIVPFFSTSQSLLFSDLTLKSGELQTFYFKCKVPRTLPPSYKGQSLHINYQMIIGATKEITNTGPSLATLHFPIRVSNYFNRDGYQPVTNLERFILLPSESIVNEQFQLGNRRRSSFKSIKGLVMNTNTSTKRDEFINQLKEYANNDDSEFKVDFKIPKTKETISNYTESLQNTTILPDLPKSITIDDIHYEIQIQKLQTQFIINRNSEHIATLTFSKPFYKVGELIKLSLDLSTVSGRENKSTTTGVLISLESLELINPKYATNPEEKPRVITHFKESLTTFSKESLLVSIPIPLHAANQFKTNLLEVKWSIYLKFILSKDEYLQKVHSDTAGDLIFAKENINGVEFSCRLPMTVLPSDLEIGGIPV